MKIIVTSGGFIFEGDVIEPSEWACRNCGGPLLEVFPSVETILVGVVGAYPYLLCECGHCESYYWKAGVNERNNES